MPEDDDHPDRGADGDHRRDHHRAARGRCRESTAAGQHSCRDRAGLEGLHGVTRDRAPDRNPVADVGEPGPRRRGDRQCLIRSVPAEDADRVGMGEGDDAGCHHTERCLQAAGQQRGDDPRGGVGPCLAAEQLRVQRDRSDRDGGGRRRRLQQPGVALVEPGSPGRGDDKAAGTRPSRTDRDGEDSNRRTGTDGPRPLQVLDEDGKAGRCQALGDPRRADPGLEPREVVDGEVLVDRTPWSRRRPAVDDGSVARVEEVDRCGQNAVERFVDPGLAYSAHPPPPHRSDQSDEGRPSRHLGV